MEIQYDDGKGRYQSFTAKVIDDDGIINNLEAYGATKEEALDELYERISGTIMRLKALQQLIEASS